MANPARESQTAATERSSWRQWALGVAVVLLAIIVIQNSQEVRVEILFGEFNAPLILVLLITALLGAVIGYVAPVLHHHRRQR
ncbi:MAG TPA: LapA family protein [Solirubrobacterales bacterium]